MIGILEIVAGYATKLERLKKPVEFRPGLNILFGPNGCGKSSALKIAAAHCSVQCNSNLRTGGWSRIQDPGSKINLPHTFYHLSPGKCKAKLEWDGTPTLLADAATTDQTSWTHFFHDKKDSPDGLSDIKDQMGVMFGRPSSGTLRMLKLKQYADALKNPPDLTKIPQKWKGYNDLWRNCAKKQAEYFSSLPRTGPVTFMLDEPDRSFSIENQMQFWTMLIPMWASKYQVIIATHCPFALIHVGAHWIDFNPEYRAKSLEALRALKPLME